MKISKKESCLIAELFSNIWLEDSFLFFILLLNTEISILLQRPWGSLIICISLVPRRSFELFLIAFIFNSQLASLQKLCQLLKLRTCLKWWRFSSEEWRLLCARDQTWPLLTALSEDVDCPNLWKGWRKLWKFRWPAEARQRLCMGSWSRIPRRLTVAFWIAEPQQQQAFICVLSNQERFLSSSNGLTNSRHSVVKSDACTEGIAPCFLCHRLS